MAPIRRRKSTKKNYVYSYLSAKNVAFSRIVLRNVKAATVIRRIFSCIKRKILVYIRLSTGAPFSNAMGSHRWRLAERRRGFQMSAINT